MTIHKPRWFSGDRVLVSTAPTCGLTKGGRLLPLVDPKTGVRVKVPDPETGEPVDAVNDKLLEDMRVLADGDPFTETDTLRYVPKNLVSLRTAVPVYYDRRYDEHFDKVLGERFSDFSSATLGELIRSDLVSVRNGHGSPSQDQRNGDVPYIKVSDLRAGFVNINPTNRVPLAVAQNYWRGEDSGLRAFDVVSPERTSKNIGDFCILMPGQERVVMTKEIIILRPGPEAEFDSFYLLWALSLKIVRSQWKRIVFMQTNREDVGKRYFEIRIPIPPDRRTAAEVSQPFRDYFTSLADARIRLHEYLLNSNNHHFFVSGAELDAIDDDDAAELVAEANAAEGAVTLD